MGLYKFSVLGYIYEIEAETEGDAWVMLKHNLLLENYEMGLVRLIEVER